jgi:ribosome maturation factor RimP
VSTEITRQVMERIQPLLLEEGMECVDLEFRRETRGWVLRLYIDKEGGITIDDCTRINQKVGRILDVENLIETPYHLEVSSPGLTRPLKNERDFIKYQNHLIKVKTVEPIGHQRLFKGKLLRVANEGIEIEMDHTILHIPFRRIAKARLELEF